VKRIITAGFLLAILVAACGEEGTTIDTVEPRPLPVSPAVAITNVEIAFNQRGLGRLGEVIGPEFVFYFDPGDVGWNPPGGSQYVIPESWSRTEFLATVGNLLTTAYSIDLSITTSGIGEPAAGAETYRAEGVPVSLLVMIDELNGYIANGGYCNFEFEKYYAANDEPRWRLTGWWDKTRADADAASIPASLGCVLAMYYPT
jgi:hypothetical protein